MSAAYRKKLIEVALPLDAINAASAREKSIRHGHPSTLHLWWARRPLAAARAVLFAQLVDDPSAWPERFPTEAAQDKERQRLFGIIERMVPWEASNDEAILNEARLEIARSWARSHPSEKAEAVLAEGVKPAVVNDYLATELPPVHDPFAGGGTIPLEAQRLGLRAIASDLNPVAVLINKALIEIPPRFAGMPPVNPEDRAKRDLKTWKGAQGLAADVRYYGAWIRERAKERIGHLYPDVEVTAEEAEGRPDLRGLEGKKLTVIAWLWARTVASPDPAAGGAHVPLVSSFWLSKKTGKKTWVEVVVAPDKRSYRFEVRTGTPPSAKAVDAGTKLGRGASFGCVLTGTPIPADHIRAEGRAGRLGTRLMAIVGEGKRRRIYVAPRQEHERIARGAKPKWVPDQPFYEDALGFRIGGYGLKTWGDLFTPRQLAALSTFSALISEARVHAHADAGEVDAEGRSPHPDNGGEGSAAYSDAIATYLAFALDKTIDGSSVQCRWMVQRDSLFNTFAKQAFPMTWDFAEVNVLADCTRSFSESLAWTAESVEGIDCRAQVLPGKARVAAAQNGVEPGAIVSTDPPYYDNIGYADLSDFFYVWLRECLREVFPSETATMLVPKETELVATPARHGGKRAAESYFMDGMTRAISSVHSAGRADVPTTIFYAFKQSEVSEGGTASTGWETFLDAVVRAGFAIAGTWPMHTERGGRSRDLGSNALATSVVLVCRARAEDAAAITRGDLRRFLRTELSQALRALQHAHIAPVDLAQAAIGPGMAVFTRHACVLEADGSEMSVRAALQLINEVLDEHLTESEADYDPDTRWAITWFEQHAYDDGAYGDAENLAKARNVSVSGVQQAGIVKSAAGKVRILKREEMRPLDYDPAKDDRPTVWEYTQHLIRNLEHEGEEAAARLLKMLGPNGEVARALAYRLYNVCERKKWAEEARAYNGLVVAWPELERLASDVKLERSQTSLFGDEN
ncbi:MAG: DUF1156 domain-containing protein [Sandaracinaceae bacterium]|nr:DUF1156 domain-containing protein [Sandaracinaceae bacterium]